MKCCNAQIITTRCILGPILQTWLLAVLFVAAVAAPVRASSPLQVGTRAPEFVLTNVMTQEEVRLGNLREEIVLMFVWNEICPLCLDDTKEMDSLVRGYVSRGVRSLIIIEHGDAFEIEMETEIYRPISIMINDPEGRLGKLYEIDSYPLFWVLDGAGMVRYRGPLLQNSALKSLLDKLLAEQS